jgi:hypothetical protein
LEATSSKDESLHLPVSKHRAEIGLDGQPEAARKGRQVRAQVRFDAIQQLELPAVGEATDNLPAPPPQPGDGDPYGLPSRIGQER